MSKRALFAFLLLALCVVVMLLNTHSVRFHLLGRQSVTAAFVYLGFLIAGFVSGMLLK